MASNYVFSDTQHLPELERLRAIEQVFDPSSHRRLQATGIATNWQCLEVGAGAGSIAHWMAAVVGQNGKVTAIDVDTRFLANIKLSNVEVTEADVRYFEVKNASFDLVHARYVLIHLPDFQVALSRMIDLLKPGGWLVLEEPDFSAARAIAGKETACQSVNRVNRAILQMFAHRGIDYALGVKLPAICQKLGLQQLSVENDAPLSQGGSGVAKVMKMSSKQLAQKYIATGEATHQDIEQYCQFAEDPHTWAIYYSTVGVSAKKAA
ncbi:class I SAM-dependent methyltransferase [Gloeocapsopsis dulcis]|uniref:SAM-dependent methyltransferase n=1 Tax=Gloeocapsopsis dulcis AAB1 = 1H9 TaxID=1433147 RepID=A0A6N8FYA5_9CHRO|nr:class I SAM-dependent methyltransferase [Gloeocapsopsis dulcis]MUL36896.1 SAM-dependent methyltransferase [Gloeocapsopsis dulcis AAB1 = 1H9]WNN88710.1 class I SAM-dependent methyltransferase [Gloeocapsopsis dulcis]